MTSKIIERDVMKLEGAIPTPANVGSTANLYPTQGSGGNAGVSTRSEAANVMDAIVRLTQSPQFNPEAVERMVALWERVRDKEAETAFNEAMALVQEEMQPVRKDANNPQTRSKYASYHALDQAVRPIYSKHGFGLSYDTGEAARDNEVLVLCYVTRGGYTRTYRLLMPADGKGAKGGEVMTRTHAVGSATKYGMRYLLGMIWNIATSEDDDGNAAGRTRPAPPRPTPTESQFITPAQLAELQALLDQSPERARKFCNRYMWEGAGLMELKPSDFGQAKEIILRVNAERARQASRQPAEWFYREKAPDMPPKLMGASMDNFEADQKAWRASLKDHDPDTGEVRPWKPHLDYAGEPMQPGQFRDPPEEVTAPPGPTQRPRPPRPVTNKPTSPPSGIAPMAHTADLPWEDQVNALVEDKPPAIANINILMKWQARCFELMPDKDTAAEFHWEHMHADGPSRWMRDIPWPSNSDTLQGQWNLLMKRWE